jgi:predicted nucleic acid-binding protein
MGPAFRVSFTDAMKVLADIKGRVGAKILADDFDALNLPALTSHAQVTDAYLVELARSKNLRLATLDEPLCAVAWASKVAFHPLIDLG